MDKVIDNIDGSCDITSQRKVFEQLGFIALDHQGFFVSFYIWLVTLLEHVEQKFIYLKV